MIAVYQDEVHFQVQTTVTASWFKTGSAPRVKSFPGHSKISYSGFVIPADGRLFVTRPEKFTYSTTIESIRAFLDANPPPDNKKYAIILDNAPWHKKAYRLIVTELASEYADIRSMAQLICLPPYSPDLNPIEQVWRITRRENTHNVFFSSCGELQKKVDAAFSNWSQPNQQLASLCSFK